MEPSKVDTVVADGEEADLRRLLKEEMEEHDQIVFLIDSRRIMIDIIKKDIFELEKQKQVDESIFSEMKKENINYHEYFMRKLQKKHKEALCLVDMDIKTKHKPAFFKFAIAGLSFFLGLASARVLL